MNLPPPLLALDVGEIIGIIFLVVSVLGWFVKVIQGKGNDAARPPAKRPDGERVRMEIETFLEEISASTSQRPPARPNPPQRPVERPRPAVAKAGKKPPKPPKPPQTAKPQKAPKQVSSLSEKHLASSNLGEGVRSHVSGYMPSDRIAAEVRQDLSSQIPSQVQSEIGRGGSVSAATTSITAVPIHPLVTLLRNPQGVRQAIALQEILQPPKALRRR